MDISKFELTNALGIYGQFERKVRKYIRENHNGVFQRISFSDSTKFVVEYRSRDFDEDKTITLSYEKLGYE